VCVCGCVFVRAQVSMMPFYTQVCVCVCVCAFWCAGVCVFVLARAYRFFLILFYTTVIHVRVFVYVRTGMCAQFCMIPFYSQVCVYAYVCVFVCCCVNARTQGFHDSLLQQGDTCVCVFTCLWTRTLPRFSCTRCVCMSVFVYVFVCMRLCLSLCRCLRLPAVFHDSVLHSGV